MDSKKIKAELSPKPKKLQDEVEALVPADIKAKTKIVNEWLQDAIWKLGQPVNDVSDFVKQLQEFNRINETFQAQRDQIDLFG